jgi:hypothetical protein
VRRDEDRRGGPADVAEKPEQLEPRKTREAELGAYWTLVQALAMVRT